MQLDFLKNKTVYSESLGGVESLANYSVNDGTHRFKKIKKKRNWNHLVACQNKLDDNSKAWF
jgi:hypothetical protein